jgi:hypothetical protein
LQNVAVPLHERSAWKVTTFGAAPSFGDFEGDGHAFGLNGGGWRQGVAVHEKRQTTVQTTVVLLREIVSMGERSWWWLHWCKEQQKVLFGLPTISMGERFFSSSTVRWAKGGGGCWLRRQFRSTKGGGGCWLQGVERMSEVWTRVDSGIDGV